MYFFGIYLPVIHLSHTNRFALLFIPYSTSTFRSPYWIQIHGTLGKSMDVCDEGADDLRMKLSVFTVCTPDLTPEQLITAATQAGIDGIEWRFASIPEEALAEEPSFWRHNRCSIDPEHTEPNVSIIKQSVQQHQLESIALVPYLKCGDLDSTHHAFATAQQLGASMMRVGVPMYDRTRHYRDLDAEATRYLSSVQELAQQYGVQALIETHHQTIAASASAALRLVEHLDPEHVGVLYDPGNMVHEGYENYRMGLQLLGPYLAHVHVKNAAWVQQDQQWHCQWAPMLEGIVPWQQIISDLQSVGYDGYLGVEDFSGQMDSFEMLQYFAGSFRELAGQYIKEGQ